MSTCPHVQMIARCFVVLLVSTTGCDNGRLEADRIAKAQSQVEQWADQLDSQTTDTGAYIRRDKEELPEKDPWNASLRVTYSQGGAAEILVVRSLGPDSISHTEDDIVAQRSVVNLKGVGQGIKKHASEMAEETAKGAVRGLIRGAKEGVKEALGKTSDDKPVDKGDPHQDNPPAPSP